MVFFRRGIVAVLLAALLLPLLPATAQARGETGEFGLTMAVGTGYLVGKTADPMAESASFHRRHPTLLDLDFQYRALPWLSPSLRVEMTLEGGEALTLAPGVVFDSNGRVVSFFGRAALAVRLEPNYYGLSIGGGVVWHMLRHLGLTAELNLEPFFLGDGLTGGFIMPILVLVGLRGNV